MKTTHERPGRPAGGDGRNRERILGAAREEFAAKGFRGATMRSIALRAGVDVALLAHYFGGKDGLFVATIELPARGQSVMLDVMSSPLAERGERLTRGYLALWEDPATSGQMQILARSVVAAESVSVHLDALITGAISTPEVAAGLKGRRVGLFLAMSHLVGVAITRHLVHLPAIADLDFETLVARTAPSVQLHLAALDD